MSHNRQVHNTFRMNTYNAIGGPVDVHMININMPPGRRIHTGGSKTTGRDLIRHRKKSQYRADRIFNIWRSWGWVIWFIDRRGLIGF